jgi:hypothetical protein
MESASRTFPIQFLFRIRRLSGYTDAAYVAVISISRVAVNSIFLLGAPSDTNTPDKWLRSAVRVSDCE